MGLVRPMRVTIVVSFLWCAGYVLGAGEVASMSPSGKADGRQFHFKVTDTDVLSAPAWAMNAPNPPLSARRAQEIARKQLDKFVREPSKWYFHELSLIDFGDHIHWLYVVRFERDYPADIAVTFGDYFEIPVLMSGAIFQPKIVSLSPDEVRPK